jgi:outer membrane protein OmpA-like peptidoglycan-associated protein
MLALCLVPIGQAQEPAETDTAGATGKVLDINSKMIDIVGLEGGVAGGPQGIQGRVMDLEGALQDLGAKVTDQEIRIELSADVLFDFDSATLRPDAVSSLQQAATFIQSYMRARRY